MAQSKYEFKKYKAKPLLAKIKDSQAVRVLANAASSFASKWKKVTFVAGNVIAEVNSASTNDIADIAAKMTKNIELVEKIKQDTKATEADFKVAAKAQGENEQLRKRLTTIMGKPSVLKLMKGFSPDLKKILEELQVINHESVEGVNISDIDKALDTVGAGVASEKAPASEVSALPVDVQQNAPIENDKSSIDKALNTVGAGVASEKAPASEVSALPVDVQQNAPTVNDKPDIDKALNIIRAGGAPDKFEPSKEATNGNAVSSQTREQLGGNDLNQAKNVIGKVQEIIDNSNKVNVENNELKITNQKQAEEIKTLEQSIISVTIDKQEMEHTNEELQKTNGEQAVTISRIGKELQELKNQVQEFSKMKQLLESYEQEIPALRSKVSGYEGIIKQLNSLGQSIDFGQSTVTTEGAEQAKTI